MGVIFFLPVCTYSSLASQHNHSNILIHDHCLSSKCCAARGIRTALLVYMAAGRIYTEKIAREPRVDSILTVLEGVHKAARIHSHGFIDV